MANLFIQSGKLDIGYYYGGHCLFIIQPIFREGLMVTLWSGMPEAGQILSHYVIANNDSMKVETLTPIKLWAKWSTYRCLCNYISYHKVMFMFHCRHSFCSSNKPAFISLRLAACVYVVTLNVSVSNMMIPCNLWWNSVLNQTTGQKPMARSS